MKVGARENVVDALTEYVSRESMRMHFRSTTQDALLGRRSLAPATEH